MGLSRHNSMFLGDSRIKYLVHIAPNVKLLVGEFKKEIGLKETFQVFLMSSFQRT